jgi:hypothetical protein
MNLDLWVIYVVSSASFIFTELWRASRNRYHCIKVGYHNEI